MGGKQEFESNKDYTMRRKLKTILSDKAQQL